MLENAVWGGGEVGGGEGGSGRRGWKDQSNTAFANSASTSSNPAKCLRRVSCHAISGARNNVDWCYTRQEWQQHLADRGTSVLVYLDNQ